MASYSMTKVSDNVHTVKLGRTVIGAVSKFSMYYRCVVTIPGKGKFNETGPTAADAFRAMVRAANNAAAQRAGYANAREMIEAKNAQVQAECAAMNALLGPISPSAGWPLFRFTVKRGRRVLV